MTASGSSPPWRAITIFSGAKRLVALSLLTIALIFGPGPEADAQELDDLELTASVGAHFIESMTGQSSVVLGIVADGSTAIRIGAAVMSGDYLHAASITGEAVADRLIGAVPIVGKVKLLADIGVWFGDRMYQITGDRNFNAMYARLSAEYPAEQWPGSFEAYRRDDFFRAEFQYFARNFADQVLRNAGYRGHILDPEAERIVFEAFIRRAALERAYDEARLTGRARTPARLREVLEAGDCCRRVCGRRICPRRGRSGPIGRRGRTRPCRGHRPGCSRSRSREEEPSTEGHWLTSEGSWDEGFAAKLGWVVPEYSETEFAAMLFRCPDIDDPYWVEPLHVHDEHDEVPFEIVLDLDGEAWTLHVAPQYDDAMMSWYAIGQLPRDSGLFAALAEARDVTLHYPGMPDHRMHGGAISEQQRTEIKRFSMLCLM